VKACPLCNRVYSNSATVCEHDGQRLASVRRNDATEGAPVVDWDGPLAGDIVGSYRLESLIAEGGMGRIFRAAHLTLGRKVAIKFLLPEHASRADLVQRFFNEARSINTIRHPHILEIHDFVQERLPDGPSKVYMVMEYLEGEDVRIRLGRKRRLTPEAVVNIGVQTAEALAAAHEKGILHRDLKPDNIFLCKRPRDFVKVLDFGAAKAFGDRPGHDLTRPGVAIGTPEYMAPEQILGVPLDGRVDGYALGVVLYELLCGKVPFSSKNVADVLAMHAQEEPPLISQRTRRPVDVPPRLEEVVMRCLRKNPRDRFADLWQVSHALTSSISGTAVTVAERRKPARGDDSHVDFEPEQDTIRAPPPNKVPADEPAPLYLQDGPFSKDSENVQSFADDSCEGEFSNQVTAREDLARPTDSGVDEMPASESGAPMLLELLRQNSAELPREIYEDEESKILLVPPKSNKRSVSWVLALALTIISLTTIAVVVWW